MITFSEQLIYIFQLDRTNNLQCGVTFINPYHAGTESDYSLLSLNPRIDLLKLSQSAHLYSLTRLYTGGCPTLSSYLYTPKIDNGKFHKCKVDYSI